MLLNDKISELIKANLPETVAGELKLFIEQAEKTASELVTANQKIDIQREDIERNTRRISERDETIARLKAQIAMCENCKERFSQIVHKEAIVSLKESHCSERIADIKEITSLAFRSPVYRKSVSAMKYHPVKDPDNNGHGGESMISYADNEDTEISEE